MINLEKKIADLEKKIQSQQQIISSQCPKDRPESLLELAVRDAQLGVHIPTFRMNLGNRTLFEQKTK